MSAVVSVACKHQPGILMRVFDLTEYDVPVLGGGTRKESRATASEAPIKINGPAVPHGQAPGYLIIGGYAITPNVPAAIATKWMMQNKDSDLVRNNLIFISDKADTVEKKAKEQKEIRSGLERLDVRSIQKDGKEVPRDPRWPAKINPNLSGVSTDLRED